MSSTIKHFTDTDGFLFIGDPHISSQRPGRRKDKDFSNRILGKLERSIQIANEKNYVPVILGDLFDRPYEESESIKNRVMRILKKANHKVVCLLGNHCRSNEKLCDDDSITILVSGDAMDLIETSGAYATYELGGKIIGLGGTPHGEDIPTSVKDAFGRECDTSIWITHHDLQMERPYPNSIPCHEIEGCKLAVNGHMHLTKKLRKEGATTWFNPGNITRQAVDAIDHIPRVFAFTKDGAIEAHEIEHEKDVFDLTGRLINSITEDISEDVDPNDAIESAFVRLIEVEDAGDMNESDDGSVVRELIEQKLQSTDMKPEQAKRVKAHVLSLLNETLAAA